MLVREVFDTVAKMLNLDALSAEPDIPQGEDAARIMTAIRLVFAEIVEEYMPQKRTERLKIQNGRISFSAFETPPLRIFSVRDIYGYNKRHIKSDSAIVLSGEGEADVCYSYALPELDLGSEVNVFKLPVRTVCYGVIGEYFLLSSRYEEGAMYNQRFRESLERLQRDSVDIVMPARRWR